jgi:hypothetical protein
MTAPIHLPGFPRIESPLFPLLLQNGCFGIYSDAALQLHRDGFVVLDLGAERMAAVADAIRADLSGCFDLKQWRETDGGLNLRVQDAWRWSRSVAELALLPELQELLQLFWGRMPIPFQTLNFPVGTQQHVHSDAVHFHSDPPGFMCGVWVALEDVHPDAGPLEYFPGSHRLPYLQARDVGLTEEDGEPRDQTHFHAYWQQAVAAQQLQPQCFTPRLGQALIWTANLLHGGAPVVNPGLTRWSQVTHYFFEGCETYTPMLSDWPRGSVAWRQPVRVCSPEVIGHLDHVWQIDAHRYVLSGWCSDPSPQAVLHLGPHGRAVPLGARISRPDVQQALQLPEGVVDLGFLVSVALDEEPLPASIMIGERNYAFTPRSFVEQSSTDALERLVNACHWSTTAPERLSELLQQGLGRALLWLREMSLRGGEPPERLDPMLVVLRLGCDRAYARARLWQLSTDPVLAALQPTIGVMPREGGIALVEQDLPDWLSELAEKTGLAVVGVSPRSILGCGCVVLIDDSAPWIFPPGWLARLLASSAAQPAVLLPGVRVLRGVDGPASWARERLNPRANQSRPRPSRRSWLLAMERWLEQQP